MKKIKIEFLKPISVALDYSKGLLKVETIEGEVKKFSKLHSCIYKDFDMPKIDTKLFSFNAPFGSCELCKGLGVNLRAWFWCFECLKNEELLMMVLSKFMPI